MNFEKSISWRNVGNDNPENSGMNEESFTVEDAAWIADEARKLWSGDSPANNRLFHLLTDPARPQLKIPDDINLSLDPFSKDYKDEIVSLWKLLNSAGQSLNPVEYNPAVHEQDAASEADPVKFPGFFSRRDPDAVRHAAYELAMLSDVLLVSGLIPGSNALEYGAGSGNIAINLSRLGVNVDTVDISAKYCDHIRLNANFFGTNLRSFNAEFGDNPRGADFKYDAIIFHACFHHSLDHDLLIGKLSGMIGADGIIILSNEPIYRGFYCPWGLKRDPESVSVISARGWMELGFDEKYLMEAFLRHDLLLSKSREIFSGIPLYVARLLKPVIAGGDISDYTSFMAGFHLPEADGIWTTNSAEIVFTRNYAENGIVLELANHFPIAKTLSVAGDFIQQEGTIGPCGSTLLKILASDTGKKKPLLRLHIRCDASCPVDHFPDSSDTRKLGLMLKSIRSGG